MGQIVFRIDDETRDAIQHALEQIYRLRAGDVVNGVPVLLAEPHTGDIAGEKEPLTAEQFHITCNRSRFLEI